MIPFARLLKYGNNIITHTNTIIKYLKDYTSVSVSVVGSAAEILYEPSPFYNADAGSTGWDAIRFLSGTPSVQIGAGGVPLALEIGDSTDFVIESYLYLSSTSVQMLIGNLSNSAGTGSYWLTLNNTFGVQSQVSLDGTSTSGTIQRFRFGTTGDVKLPVDRWIHIKLQRIGSSLSFYLDGVQVGASQVMTMGFRNVSTNVMRIGCSSDSAYPLRGAIDSFRMEVQR